MENLQFIKLKKEDSLGPSLIVIGQLAALTGSIIIIIAAFKQSVITGLLSLFLPFYILYFAFAKYESKNKGKVLLIWLGGIILYIIGALITIKTLAPKLPLKF